MRIIAGEFRRRTLLAPPGLTTRPIPDRVKESFFGMLGTRIEGAAVVDLFAGSGAIGLEAVSRGARSVMHVDRDKRALVTLERNIYELGCQDRSTIVAGDALGLSIVARCPRPVDLVFIDPPYDLMRLPGGVGWERVRKQAAALGALLADDGFLVIRSPWPFLFLNEEMQKRRDALIAAARGKATGRKGATVTRDEERRGGGHADRWLSEHERKKSRQRGGVENAEGTSGSDSSDSSGQSDSDEAEHEHGGALEASRTPRKHAKAGKGKPGKGEKPDAQEPIDFGSLSEDELDAQLDALDDQQVEELLAKYGQQPAAGAESGADESGEDGSGSQRSGSRGSGADADAVKGTPEEIAELQAMMDHQAAAAARDVADLHVPGLFGPETHEYGKTAVHWYAKPRAGQTAAAAPDKK